MATALGHWRYVLWGLFYRVSTAYGDCTGALDPTQQVDQTCWPF